MSSFKTIGAPDRGVNAGRDPHLINPRQWRIMKQMRARLGVVSNFPGWTTLLNGGNVGSFGLLADEFQKTDGTSFIILAGGPTGRVYYWNSATRTLVDITGAAVLAATRSDFWFPFVYNNIYYITNLIDGLYKWTGSGNIVAVSAPKARAAGVLNDHIVVLNYNDGTHFPQGFAWASEGTDDTWSPAQNNDAGSFQLVDTYDVGVALYHLGNDIIAYKERTIIPITFIGGNEVFGRRQSVAGVGLVGPNAIATISDRHVFMGQDSFYQYSGGNTVDDSIADLIRERVYTDLHRSLRVNAQALYDEEHDEIVFFYPSLNATEHNDKAVVHNLKENTWYGPFDVNCTVAGLSYSTYQGLPLLMFINEVGVPMHIGDGQSNNGTAIERELESGDHYLADNATNKYGQPIGLPPGSVFQVINMKIEVENIGGGDVEFYLGSRMELNDNIDWSGPYLVKAARKHTITINVRKTGRWFRTRFKVPGSAQFTLFATQYEFNYVGVR